MQSNEDIDLLVKELRYTRAHTQDTALITNFILKHAHALVELLHELKRKRGEDSSEQLSVIKENSHRIIVEGFSEDDINGAFSDALEKVIPYFSEHHDANVTVLSLSDLPKGGHRATLEVHLTPITTVLSDTMEDPDAEIKRIHERNVESFKTIEEKHLQHLIHHHFLNNCQRLSGVPENFLIHIRDADILNMMVKNDFFQVATKQPSNDIPSPSRAMIRVLRPDDQTAFQ